MSRWRPDSSTVEGGAHLGVGLAQQDGVEVVGQQVAQIREPGGHVVLLGGGARQRGGQVAEAGDLELLAQEGEVGQVLHLGHGAAAEDADPQPSRGAHPVRPRPGREPVPLLRRLVELVHHAAQGQPHGLALAAGGLLVAGGEGLQQTGAGLALLPGGGGRSRSQLLRQADESVHQFLHRSRVLLHVIGR